MAIEHLFAFAFPFVPIGETRYYMGGDCLPALMTFRDAFVTLHRTDPALHAWMTEGVPVG